MAACKSPEPAPKAAPTKNSADVPAAEPPPAVEVIKQGLSEETEPVLQSLRTFEFRGVVAGEVVDRSALRNVLGQCKPQSKGSVLGDTECIKGKSTVAGERVDELVFYFYEGKLTAMVFWIERSSASYINLLAAFNEKYGAPCAMDTEKMQTRAGAIFDNHVSRWCFSTGELELREFDRDLDTSLVEYVDREVNPPSKKPPVDF